MLGMLRSVEKCAAVLASAALLTCMLTRVHIHIHTLQDIDELLNRGEERTEELKEKIEKVAKCAYAIRLIQMHTTVVPAVDGTAVVVLL
jgi:hypothetical protein